MRLFKRLLNPNYKPDDKTKKSETSEQSSYYPEETVPADEKFMLNFKRNGGKFIYCEDWNEILDAFDNILLENDWYEQDVFCYDKQLMQRFDGFNLNFTNNAESKFLFSTCEALIAHRGEIMLSSRQMREKKLGDLPEDVIIFATTSQIVETLSDGLRIINTKRSGTIPSNITTIQHFKIKESEDDFMSYGSSSKNLYLLLLEDL
ncbi:MAG: LUD domain-containing protein [Bacteroidetes bacterium]|jgi:hypothetical protein|nr:LUD domain-containing protein [Bacteroidota bacterium]